MKQAGQILLCLHFSEEAEKTEAQETEATEQVNDGTQFRSLASHFNVFFYFAFFCLASIIIYLFLLLLKRLHHADAGE